MARKENLKKCVCVSVLNRVVRVGLIKKVTGKQRLGGSERVSHLDIRGKSVSGRENSWYKSPAVRLKNSKAENMDREEQSLLLN